MAAQRSFSTDEARRVGEAIGIDWASAAFDVEEFRIGMNVELEHGLRDPQANVTDDDPVVTGKIALVHLNGLPDYYTRLERMEKSGKREKEAWQIKPSAGAAPHAGEVPRRPAQPPELVLEAKRPAASEPSPAAVAALGLDESVVRWRLEQLLHAGYGAGDAQLLARHDEIDLHIAINLVRRGCPPGTAQRILF